MLKRNVYFVYRKGTNERLYTKALCTPLEIKKYIECLNVTDKFGFTYYAIKVD